MMEKLRDEIVALIAFVVALAGLCSLGALYGADLVAALGLRDITLALLGALIALLTRSGVNIASDRTSVDTTETPPTAKKG